MQIINNDKCEAKCNLYSTADGCTEYYITLKCNDNLSFETAIDELSSIYRLTLKQLELNDKTIYMSRVYVSDIANEFSKLILSKLYEQLNAGAVSVVQQSPLSGPVTILIYHLKSEKESWEKELIDPLEALYTKGQNYSLLWTVNTANNSAGSGKQTDGIFNTVSTFLSKYKMSLKNNTIRTWIYVRDIDNNYKEMVDSRRELFNKIGLTEKTRYIASTGIEGRMVESRFLVSMDALSIGNIKEEQIVKMEAPENMSSTAVYNVTFERGTRIRFGDRSHLHISGTASIDIKGEILHIGDIRGQTERTLDNVEALLSRQNATLADMRYIILYLRNRKHFQFIQDIITSRIPDNVLLIPVEGSVCRPGWLIEMEGIAIIQDRTEYPPFI